MAQNKKLLSLNFKVKKPKQKTKATQTTSIKRVQQMKSQ
jgi:hypothetical protein